MNKIFYLLAVVITLSACERQPEGYTINGIVEGYPEGTAVLKHRMNSEFYTLDTTSITDGRFTLEGVLDFPEMCYIVISEDLPAIRVFVENSRITVEAHIDSLSNPRITGSAIQDKLNAYNKTVEPFEDSLRSTYRNYLEASRAGDTEKAADLEKVFDQISDAQKMVSLDFVRDNSDNVIAPYLVWGTLVYDLSLDELKRMAAEFSPELEQSSYVTQIRDHISTLEKVAIGQPFTDIIMEDPEGKTRKLSDLKGKLVLVDFWASWCGPCRRENPNVVKLYNEYKDKNFEIFGVSFDTDGEKWIKAIEDDGLTWYHVSDLKGWQSAAGKDYGVRAIPHTVLISPDGIILEKNLRGEELREKIQELTAG